MVQGASNDVGMASVTVGGPGLVAVGGDGTDAAVWTSVDGFTWSRVPHDEVIFGAASMGSVTVGGPGLVAVGSTSGYRDDGDADDGDAVVWTSPDGIVWSRVPHDEAIFGGENNQTMYDVTAGGPGLVAVGRDGVGGWDNTSHNAAAVWTSVDGITWSRVPHDEEVFGKGGNPAMLSVTAGGPGLVAVGVDGRLGGSTTPRWTSPDGIAWSRVPHDETVG